MRGIAGVFLTVLTFLWQPVSAQTMQLTLSDADFEITNIVSDVDLFDFQIEINAPLAAGVYNNPPLTSVSYRVFGSLIEGTPSGFEVFDLMREITGEEFYAQGSSLQFEIDENAVLEDGVQIDELSGTDVVFRFNGREVGNERFHPALLELRADGTGRIQNSNNTPTLDPLLEIDFGSEYINDLLFDPGNTTLLTGQVVTDTNATVESESSGGGAFSIVLWLMLMCSVFCFNFTRAAVKE